VLTRLSLLLCLLALAPVAPAAAQAPVEGVDYVRIPGGERWRPEPGTIEVVEVFAYPCGHCDRFRPMLAQWTRRAGADVRVYHVPAAYQPDNAYARGYFALEALGRAAELHPRVFDAIHREATLPAHNASRAEIVAFLAGEGLDPAAVAAAMDAPATDEKMNAAYAFAVRSGIQGTPTLIINGRYRVQARTLDDSLRIADGLVAMERERAAAR
jgi:thiol:disulfide interchange protein DsbA